MREIATRARTYDVTEKAIKASRRRRLIMRTATPACAAALVAVVILTVGKHRDQQMALWSPSGEFRWFPRPPGMQDKIWMLDPIGVSGDDLLFRTIHDTMGDTNFVRWNPRPTTTG
jgi:hypothetical protein